MSFLVLVYDYCLLMISELAEAIASYLQEGSFAGISDVGLFVAATRQAAFHSRRKSSFLLQYLSRV